MMNSFLCHLSVATLILLSMVGQSMGTVLKAKAQMFAAAKDFIEEEGIVTYLGAIDFTQKESSVFVNGTLQAIEISDGLHAFHIHQLGDVVDNCGAAGAHFNPEGHDHGAPNDTVRHVGDLGNVKTANGQIIIELNDTKLALNGEHSIIGRAVVIHEGVDDMGRGNTTDSKKTGSAGKRVACGVIGIVQEKNGGVSVLLGNGLTTLCATLALLVAKLYYYCH